MLDKQRTEATQLTRTIKKVHVISITGSSSNVLRESGRFCGICRFRKKKSAKKKRQIRVRAGAGPAGGACRRGVGPAPPPRAPEFVVFFVFFLRRGFSKHESFFTQQGYLSFSRAIFHKKTKSKSGFSKHESCFIQQGYFSFSRANFHEKTQNKTKNKSGFSKHV